jgi:GT2 family glycosyltransferase
MKVSVVISTFNRPKKVRETITCFSNQTLPIEDYEIIVVDNGSQKPVELPTDLRQKNCRLIRFEKNQERSISRNTGVESANGEFLLFSDDDMILEPDFLENHLKAHNEWVNLMAIGKIILPPEKLSDPGIKFRQNLELTGIPTTRGLVSQPNFGTAANMSINKELYQKLGGFDPQMAGIEDQDFAMRHTKNGGQIVYLPEAVSIHNDDWLDFISFCKRQEFGADWTVAFSRRYPKWGDTQARELVNGHLKLGKEPVLISLKKIVKSILGTNLGKMFLSNIISVFEKLAPNSGILRQLYIFTLGVYIQKGYRRGIEKYGNNI